MSLPRVVAVTPGSPAARAGLLPGDEIVAMAGQVPRDVIQYQLLADEPEVELRAAPRRPRADRHRWSGDGNEPLGIEVHSALFDQVRTCDNHCEFCFIYQLPKGLRPSLYVKDDDYRLSFLYGNFTTLTRFTEADLERVVTEGLSPLWVSIHATDPDVRARMLRNRRGATSLRWLRALLDHGIEIHGQVVVCPGINDGAVLDDTLAGVLDEYPELATVACVPLGVSRYTTEAAMRAHTGGRGGRRRRPGGGLAADLPRRAWAAGSCSRRTSTTSSPGRPFPLLETYEDLLQHENGIGMAAAFEASFSGRTEASPAVQSGFFQAVDGAPALGYRAPRTAGPRDAAGPRRHAPVAVVSGEYGARILGPAGGAATAPGSSPCATTSSGATSPSPACSPAPTWPARWPASPRATATCCPTPACPAGVFIDGLSPDDLPRAVEVIGTDARSLREALQP